MFVVEVLSTAFAFVILQLIMEPWWMKEQRLKNNSLYDMIWNVCCCLKVFPIVDPLHHPYTITHLRYILRFRLSAIGVMLWRMCEPFVFSTTYYERLSYDSFKFPCNKPSILYVKTWNLVYSNSTLCNNNMANTKRFTNILGHTCTHKWTVVR